MTDRSHTHRPGAADTAVEELLSQAAPRPTPPPEDEAQVYAAVHAEWDRLTGARRRRAHTLRFGLAASVLVAVFAGLLLLRAPDQGVVVQPVAAVGKRTGEVRIAGSDQAPRDAQVFSGDRIETGADAGVALAWERGGSLRIDRESRIDIVSRTRIRLLAGRIYYDSADNAMSGAPPAGPARILIDTPHGTLRHLGTQFAAELTSDGLSVAVREGLVRIESDDTREIAEAGQRLLISTNLPIRYSAIDATDDFWRWAERLAPPVTLDGRSVYEALRWISRESGRAIRFESAAAEQAARDQLIVGLDEFGRAAPSRALDGILSISGFDWRIEQGVIVVGEHETGEDDI